MSTNSEQTTDVDRIRFVYSRYPSLGGSIEAREAEFERWLTEHDRAIAAAAWQEGALWAAVELNATREGEAWLAPGENPYALVTDERTEK